MLRLFSVLVFCLVFSLPVHAAECPPTPSVPAQYDPGKDAFPHSNNLRRKTGMAEFASGIPLTVEGTVLDKQCVPVMGAVVELWQANSYGGYRYAAGKARSGRPDPNFAGAGRVTTDNMGRFQFLTVMPGEANAQSPRLFFRIRTPNAKPLNTAVFLGSPSTDKTTKGLKAPVLEKLSRLPEEEQSETYLPVTFIVPQDQKYRE